MTEFIGKNLLTQRKLAKVAPCFPSPVLSELLQDPERSASVCSSLSSGLITVIAGASMYAQSCGFQNAKND